MSQNPGLVEEIKKFIDLLKLSPVIRQKEILEQQLENFKEEIKELSLEEKKEILLSAVSLKKKSYVGMVAKAFNIDLKDKSLKLWTQLENFGDRSYVLQILENQENWNDFEKDHYFFEKVVLFGQKIFTDDKAKNYYQKLVETVAHQTTNDFWLSEERTQSISKFSYIIIRHKLWSDFCTSLVNLRPNWLATQSDNEVNKSNSEKKLDFFENKEIDWQKIINNNADYSPHQKDIVRRALEKVWLQKTQDGKFVLENDNIQTSFLSQMWLFREKHFEIGIFTTQEKEKLLEKVLNDKSAFLNIKSKTTPGQFTRMVLEECIKDENVKWNTLKLGSNAQHALEIGEYNRLVANLSLKCKLESDFESKNKPDKKSKI